MKSINRASYLTSVRENFSGDRVGRFLNSIKILPHKFGHQYGSGKFSTHGYRLMGDYEIIFFVGGESTITVDDNNYICKKGDFLFIPPFVKHSISTTWENPHDNYWMHFDIIPLSSSYRFTKLFTGPGSYVTHIGSNDRLLFIYQNLEQEYNACGPGLSSLFKASVLYVLTEVAKQKKSGIYFPADNCSTNMQSLAEDILSYIDGNIKNSVSVKSLCRKFNISKTCLNDTFTATVGISPGKMIQYLKLKKAENMLLATSMSIEEIADMLCYSSPSYFSNTFKKNYGMPPGIYRQTYI